MFNFDYIPDGVILYGDSVFFGIGSSKPSFKGCGKLVKNGLDIEVDLRCKLNVTSDYALENLEKKVISRPLKFCIVNFGNNDSRLNEDGSDYVSLDKYYDNITSLIKHLKSSNIKPIICNLQPIDDIGFYSEFPFIKNYSKKIISPSLWHKRYSDASIEAAKNEGSEYIDIRKVLVDSGKLCVINNGHPNDYGHRLIADTIIDKMNKLLIN